MCFAKIWPLVFLNSPHLLLDGFWGPQGGFFGFSSGVIREGMDKHFILLRTFCFNTVEANFQNSVLPGALLLIRPIVYLNIGLPDRSDNSNYLWISFWRCERLFLQVMRGRRREKDLESNVLWERRLCGSGNSAWKQIYSQGAVCGSE